MTEERVRIGRIVKDKNDIPCLRKVFTDAAGTRNQLYIPVKDILQEVDNGTNLKQLKKKFNNCKFTRDDIRVCRAFAAVTMPERREYKKNARERRMKILLDENMPYQLITPLLKKFGGLTHIYFEGMEGFADEFIYYRPFYQLKKKTQRERIKDIKTRYVIFTRDRDMVDIARAQWLNRIRCSATPEDIRFAGTNVIIHIQDASFAKAKNSKALTALADQILEMIESKQACAYSVKKDGVAPIGNCRLDEMIKRVAEEDLRRRIAEDDLTDDERIMVQERQKGRKRRRKPEDPAPA
ncbi:MAG: hypothetical protein GC136_05800 [Alphaproteobacteria bacterium]|nr:hypothetical protein [Alphaproteobacteria bacterium]